MRARVIWDYGRAVFAQAVKHDVGGLSAEIAMRSFLELFPFFVFLASIGDAIESKFTLTNPARLVLEWLEVSLPQGAAEPIRQQLESVLGTHESGQMAFPVLGALWLAAGSGATLLKAMNRVYELEETRPFWERYLVGLWLTVLAGIVLFGATLVMSTGRALGEQSNGWFWTTAGVLRWPLVLLLLMLEAGVVYRVAPNHKPPWRFISPGASLFAGGWLVASAVFVIYIDKSGGYAATYGVLGGVIVLLLWLQLTALALLLGAELNDALVHRQADADNQQKSPPLASRH